MQSLWLIIVVFFLVVILVPIAIKIHVTYDILNNLGTFSLYIFFIKIFCYKVKIKNKTIILVSSKNKKEIETELSKVQLRFLEQLNVQLKQKLIVKKIAVFSRIGVKDAKNSALLCGFFEAIVCSILAYVKNTKKSAKMLVDCQPDYNGLTLCVGVYGSFAITITDIVYSLIMSAIISKRSEKYETI